MDIERSVQFLLDQQAKHDAQISELRTFPVNVAQSEERSDGLIEVLAERQVKTEEELAYVTTKVGTVAERQAKTEETLQILIQLFQNTLAATKELRVFILYGRHHVAETQ